MTRPVNPFAKLLEEDPRFPIEAYQFVRDALGYAQKHLSTAGSKGEGTRATRTEDDRHLTGQQLCEAIRRYALDQYGFMALTVLRNWGIHKTSHFGDIVYNLIEIGEMKKSKKDRREDFDEVYDFERVFRDEFDIAGA
jgi:uncharacterized repeat protein (TIGR04138 family)